VKASCSSYQNGQERKWDVPLAPFLPAGFQLKFPSLNAKRIVGVKMPDMNCKLHI